jgi:hypothetical protein
LTSRPIFLSLALALVSATAPAAVLFDDNFDSSLGATALSAAVPGWTTTSGTVDYIKQGGFGLSCLGNTGGCIDLDGSTNDAGNFAVTAAFNLIAGVTYEVSYYLSGNQRNAPNDTVTVTFGGASNVHVLSSASPYTQYVLSVTPLANLSTSLVISNAGGDNFGAMLDSVVVQDASAIPEPSTVALLGAGLAALAWRRRR